MIVGERILEVSGNRVPREAIKGLNINIQLDGVEKAKDNIEITYTYIADKQEEVGQIKIKGLLIAKEEEKLAKEIVKKWKKEKKKMVNMACSRITSFI